MFEKKWNRVKDEREMEWGKDGGEKSNRIKTKEKWNRVKTEEKGNRVKMKDKWNRVKTEEKNRIG